MQHLKKRKSVTNEFLQAHLIARGDLHGGVNLRRRRTVVVVPKTILYTMLIDKKKEQQTTGRTIDDEKKKKNRPADQQRFRHFSALKERETERNRHKNIAFVEITQNE
jgi:hypothetical protein